MDIIFITDLRIETVIGIFDWEREIKQTVALDIEMAGDISKAALSDDIRIHWITRRFQIVSSRSQPTAKHSWWKRLRSEWLKP